MSGVEWLSGPPERGLHGQYPAGVLLLLRDGGVILVGHMNVRSGVCDDCTADFLEQDIMGHRYVWRGDEWKGYVDGAE